jgi:hypothetical protein
VVGTRRRRKARGSRRDASVACRLRRTRSSPESQRVLRVDFWRGPLIRIARSGGVVARSWPNR